MPLAKKCTSVLARMAENLWAGAQAISLPYLSLPENLHVYLAPVCIHSLEDLTVCVYQVQEGLPAFYNRYIQQTREQTFHRLYNRRVLHRLCWPLEDIPFSQ